ncbi:MAG TPA: PD-(D/E)XK nuclease family protein [Vicinamibacterales bacterium]|nr:PD-(D/E)XK nuclease family protein [Vicinamibacterales bacterium]
MTVTRVSQRRTLIRARDLAAFRAAVIDRALSGAPMDARRRAVVVPTRAAAELLRQSIETGLAVDRPPAVVLPDFVTRRELVERLGAAMPEVPRLLSGLERLVLLERAAARTSLRPRMSGSPFPLRPGLIAAMLDFYDELHRRQRPVRRFAEALFDQLRGERGADRGSDSLIHQTCFLGFTFLAYERAVAATGALDEHGLRRVLLAGQPPLPYDHIVIAVADHPSDPRGLWPADFDLLGRLRALATIEVVVTDALHDAGFRERMETELPGIEEARIETSAATASPVILRPVPAPGGEGADEICVVSRDREDELRDVARAVRHSAPGGDLSEPTAVVFHRPLPYLYLAQRVFTEAHVPYQALDALPLAAQPYAAMLDVVLTAARTGATRGSAVELLRNGLLHVEVDGERVTGRDVAALDEALAARRTVAEADTFAAEVLRARSGAGATRAAKAAASVREQLLAFRDGASASAQVRVLLDFLRMHEQLPAQDDPWRERHLRARSAVQTVLAELAAAYERHDDHKRSHEEVAAAIRFAIEAETFSPERAPGGVRLVDAVAARFGTFDHAHIVGLVETDWPERPRRNIFYTAGLLKSLGWPQEPDQARVQQAMFGDLLGLPARTLTLHAFAFEGDALLARSPLVEIARDRTHARLPARDAHRIFDDEVLTAEGIGPDVLGGERATWLAMRQARPELGVDAYGGFVGPQPARRYRVSRVDHYVLCPFKYFAENVLGLPEERDDMAGLTPLERGNLIHSLFEQFYKTWDERHAGTITAANLPDAVALFAELAEAALALLPEADRVLERTRLLGSLVAAGVAERVFELEADRGGNVVRRHLERDLKGPFTFPLLGGLKTRTVEISGKADRIDVFADGSLRVIDYKLSRLPDVKSSIQIAVYAMAAQQWLQGEDGKSHPIAAAAYLAFGDEDRLEGALGSRDQPAAIAVEARAAEFAAVIERIEQGEFPPQPRQPNECTWCRYAGVCRKEYRETEDETAEPV